MINRARYSALAFIMCLLGSLPACSTDPILVPGEVMNRIYEEVKTPFKVGIVLQHEGDSAVDCPSVFRYDDLWYMTYIAFGGNGYETHLAESEDLVHWSKLGKILGTGHPGWDSLQSAGYVALQNRKWGGSNELTRYKGKYWMSYIGGALPGYETPPLSIGVAYSENPAVAEEWTRITDHPVLDIKDPDVRHFESAILYKSNIIRVPARFLGHPFVMFYNAKSNDTVYNESIGMAVSDDMIRWKRYGADAVLDHHSGITGDPQVVRIDDVWVMFYFGAFWKPKAFDRFACSYDLVNWTDWTGPNLIEPTESWDETYAHKPWVIKHDGVVYHFYCAVGSEGRAIALATSEPL